MTNRESLEFMRLSTGINLDNGLSEAIKEMYLSSDKYKLGQSYKNAIKLLNILEIDSNDNKDLVQGLMEYEFYARNPIALKSLLYIINCNDKARRKLRDSLLEFRVDTYKYLVDLGFCIQFYLELDFLKEDMGGYLHTRSNDIGKYILNSRLTKGKLQEIYYVGKKLDRCTIIHKDTAYSAKKLILYHDEIIEEATIESIRVYLDNPFEDYVDLIDTLDIKDIPVDLDWLISLE